MTQHRNIEQIRIISGVFTTRIYFRDLLGVKANLTGRLYRNPSAASWGRLIKVMNNKTLIEIELESDDPDDIEVIGWHVYPMVQS
jgi:hypothetical protein